MTNLFKVFLIVAILAAVMFFAYNVGKGQNVLAETEAYAAALAQPAQKQAVQPAAPAAKPAEEETADEKETVIRDLDGLKPITVNSGYEVFTTVQRSDAFQPVWPEGTNQPSVGYSNPEEYADGRTFWTRNPTTGDEILAFVAQCVSINDGPKVCHDKEHGALVGMIQAGPDGEWPVTLWDAELKTLIVPGGLNSWQAYTYELATFISSNKSGKPVEILGPAS